MKKRFLVLIALVFLILFFVIFRVGFDLQGEDSWIKDSRGVYVKHGNPSLIPDYVKEQQDAINCANLLYNENKNLDLSSECLGICGDFAVDIVHVPRVALDDLSKNQCSDYKLGKVNYFIEL
ncbi:MAG: hypothetical protein WC584_03485 [Candidatus Pacearchaeota archaeon]